MDTLEQAYESAAAVLTAPVSFVEWTALKVERSKTPNPRRENDWSPLLISLKSPAGGDWGWDTTQDIEGARYIYVFTRRFSSYDDLTLAEELWLDADGTIYGAQKGPRQYPDPPLDGKDAPWKPGPKDSSGPKPGPKHVPGPEERKWELIGKTMRFVRRLRGAQMVHYFFASRIQLSSHFVQRLRISIAGWVPETLFDDFGYVQPMIFGTTATKPSTFGEWDTNVVTGAGTGSLQVPVLDPLTIALNLHALATCAANDLSDYSAISDDQTKDRNDRVRQRQKKILLAHLVHMVMANYERDSWKFPVSAKTDSFIQEYGEQMDYRIGETERWWKHLANWYQSEPIRFLAQAHYEFPNDNRWSFFLPMALCLLGANWCKPGIALVTALVKAPPDWLRSAVLPNLNEEPEEDQTAEKYQAPRKFLLAILEVFKELAPHIFDRSTESMFRVLSRYSKNLNVRFMIGAAELDPVPLKAAKQFEANVKAMNTAALRIEVPDAEEIIEEWHEIAGHHSFVKVLKLATVVELIDLTLSFRQLFEDPSVAHAFTAVRSTADMTALLLEFAHGTQRKFLLKLFNYRYAFVLVAALIEAVSSYFEMKSAADKHDTAGAVSGFLTFGGSTATILGAIDGLGLGLAETPYFVVGLILMGIGAIVGFFKDTPMDTFLKHCAFGTEDHLQGEIVEGLGEMKKDDYGKQIEILVNLLCMFKLEQASNASQSDLRQARFTMGWIPEGAKLVVKYHDEWNFKPGGSSGITQTKANYSFTERHSSPLNEDREFWAMLSNAPQFGVSAPMTYYFKSHFEAKLEVALDDLKFTVPPSKLVELDVEIGLRS